MCGHPQVLGFDGILNSTTNIILTEMESTKVLQSSCRYT